MKITHYNNSFLSVRSQGGHIVCDPWMGKANSGGWQSFPEYPVEPLAQHLSDAQWVYLSHLHDDHFHPETLKALGLLDRTFLIKRFESPVMRERLRRLGVTRIHELDPFTTQRVGPFEVAIFPQMTSNSSGLDDDVNYDLDTSIVLKADSKVFFNQVDNPLSTADLTQLRDWTVKHLGPIDIACLMCGAAGEYPQLFLGIDQEGEKRRIVHNALNELVTWLRLLEPTCYFPAGGTYLIPGWQSIYNHNIAQPGFQDILQRIQHALPSVLPLELEGGHSIEISNGKALVHTGPEVMPTAIDRQAAIRMHSADPYAYEEVIAPSFPELVQALDSARVNWLQKVQLNTLHITQSIRFEVYRELAVKEGLPDPVHRLGSYQLFESGDRQNGDLTIHMDQRALYGCLTRSLVWNGVLGSLCLYERQPNRHYPTDFFSLNHLTV